MSKCPHCGTEEGMAWGTGDCGCESDPDIGADFGGGDPIEAAERRARTEARHRRYTAAPRVKAVIELEGPGLEGLQVAETMLMMAGWPPEEGETSGEYTDSVLKVTCRWQIK